MASELERHRNATMSAQQRLRAVESRMRELGHTLTPSDIDGLMPSLPHHAAAGQTALTTDAPQLGKTQNLTTLPSGVSPVVCSKCQCIPGPDYTAQLDRAFDTIDTNHDGVIQRDEWEAAAALTATPSKVHLQHCLHHLSQARSCRCPHWCCRARSPRCV